MVFGPDSVLLTVENLVQEKTIRSQLFLWATFSLVMSQGHDFLKKQLAQVPISPNQQKTMEMWDEVLSSVGLQDWDTSEQVSGVSFRGNWISLGGLSPEHGCSLQTRHRDSFLPPTSNCFEMDSMAEDLILVDQEHDRENSPLLPPLLLTAISERPTQPLMLSSSSPFGTRIERFRILFKIFVWIFHTHV